MKSSLVLAVSAAVRDLTARIARACTDVEPPPGRVAAASAPRARRRPPLEQLETRRLFAAISWDGGGDGSSWGDRFNWSADAVPTYNDDVTISVAGSNPTVTLTSSVSAKTVTSDETVVISGAAGNLYVYNGATLNGTTTVSGGTLTLNGTWSNAGALNLASGALNLNGTWSSTGTQSVSGGTLTMNGTFSSAAMGTWSRSGGTVNFVGGTLTNTGGTLTLDAATTGTWNFSGGTVLGGTVATAGGATFNVTGQSTFNGVTIDTDSVLITGGQVLWISNGLTINSGRTLAVPGMLRFNGTQTLGGAGTVSLVNGTMHVYGGSSTLTIDSGVTVRGYGSIARQSADTIINNGTIKADAAAGPMYLYAPLTNNGTIRAVTNSFNLVAPNWTNAAGGTISIEGGTASLFQGAWSNAGTIAVSGGTLNVTGTFTTAGLGTWSRSGSGVVNFTSGTLSNTGSTVTFDPATIGSWNIAGGTILGGTIATVGAATLNVTGQSTFNAVTIDTDNVMLANGQILWISNGLTINSGRTLAVPGTLRFNGTQTLAGAGTVSLVNGTMHVYGGSSTLTIDSGITVRGYGSIARQSADTIINNGTIKADAAGGPMYLYVPFTNNGTIRALTNSLNLSAPSWTNAATGTISFEAGTNNNLQGTWSNVGAIAVSGGTLNVNSTFTTAAMGAWSRTGGTVNFTGGTLTNTGATLTLDSATTGSWNISSGTIAGGTLATAGGAAFNVTGQPTFSGVTIDTDNVVLTPGQILWISNGLTINSGRTLAVPGMLRFNGTQTLGGAGTVSLVNGTMHVYGGSSAVTIGSGVTIRGYGSFSRQSADTLVNNGTITADATAGPMYLYVPVTNNGTIRAAANSFNLSAPNWTNATGGTISFEGGTNNNIQGTWSNAGTIAVSGGTLNHSGTFTTAGLGTWSRTGGTVNLTGGTFNNTGGTVTFDSGSLGSWNLSGGTIQGGSVATAGGATLAVTGNPTLSGVTLDADLTVSSGQTLWVNNGLTLNGTLTVPGTVRFTNTQTLGGTGTLLITNGTVTAYNSGGMTLTLGSGVTVRGRGTINRQGSVETIVNNGTIKADDAVGALYVYTPITNNGTIRAINNSVNFYGPTTANAAGGTISIEGGTASSLNNAWSNAGTISVSGGTLNLAGNFTAAAMANWNRTGGTVNITGTLDNTGNTWALDGANGSVNLSGTLKGGTVTAANGASLNLVSSGTLDGVTLNTDFLAPAGTTLYVKNGLTVNATLSSLAATRFQGTQTLGGTGAFAMGAGASMYLDRTGGTEMQLSVAHGMTLRGQGTIMSQYTSALNRIINHGTIMADVPTKDLYFVWYSLLDNASDGTLRGAGGRLILGATGWTNAGTLSVEGGVTTAFNGWKNTNGTFDVSGGQLTLTGPMRTADLGTWQRSGGTVVLDNNAALDNAASALNLTPTTTGSWDLAGATIAGGTITLSGGATLGLASGGTFDGVRLNSNLAVATGGTLTIKNGLELNAELSLNPTAAAGSTLKFIGSQQLFGSGSVTMNGADTIQVARLNGATPATLTVEQNITVNARGSLSGESVINRGTFHASSTSSFSVSGTLFENQGTARVSAGTLGMYSATFRNSGSVAAEGTASLLLNSQTVEHTGTMRFSATSTSSVGGALIAGRSFGISGTEVGLRYEMQGMFASSTGGGTGTALKLQRVRNSGGVETYDDVENLTGQAGTRVLRNLERNTGYAFRTHATNSTGGTIIRDFGAVSTRDHADTSGWYRVTIYDPNGNRVTSINDPTAGVTWQQNANCDGWGFAGSPNGALVSNLDGFIPPDEAANADTVGDYDGSPAGKEGIPLWHRSSSGLVSRPYSVWTFVPPTEWWWSEHRATYTVTIEQRATMPETWWDPMPEDWEDPQLKAWTEDPIRYYDGAVQLQTDDLVSYALGGDFGHSRSWTNLNQFEGDRSNGKGWVNVDLPYLLNIKADQKVTYVRGPNDVVEFKLTNGVFKANTQEPMTLARNATTKEYTLTDGKGRTFVFYDFSSDNAASRRGEMKSRTDTGGSQAYVNAWTADGHVAEVRRKDVNGVDVESWLYEYLPSGNANEGMLEFVRQRTADGQGGWETVREVQYAYYGADEANGARRDLKTATIRNGDGDVIDEKYYRYFKEDEAYGYVHAMKYVFDAPAFARLKAAVADPLAATDAQVAPYADHYFQYDDSRRVTKHVIPGFGSSAAGGLGTFTYAYSKRCDTPGPNTWAFKTVETLPDGNENVAYSNAAGQMMLKVFKNLHDPNNPALEGKYWAEFYKYDASGKVLWHASPSAITGYDETKPDLLNAVNGNYQYLADNAGAIFTASYYASTTGTETTGGGVLDLPKISGIQPGELGSSVPLSETKYYVRAGGGATTYPVAASTVFANTGGGGARTTNFAYDWYTGTTQIRTRTTTLPLVSTAQNGSGSADAVTDYFNRDNELTWSRNANGFLSYFGYDAATGSLVKTITDVDASASGDFTGLPTGWSTPAGGGAHLMSVFVVDEIGRTTRTTDANGNVTYFVHDDANREVRTYRGFNPATGTTAAPIEVARKDLAGGYDEVYTMATTPHLTNGVPDGTEAIANVRSLERRFFNLARQLVARDRYFDLDGIPYGVTPTLGVEGENYYRATYTYNVNGVMERAVADNDTITIVLSDSLGRPTATWVGTDDTPTTGAWSPTNNAGANMVKVSQSEYDNGLVGDGNLTALTVHPGGGAAPRTTRTWYDWRNRPVITKSAATGDPTTESTSLQRPLTYVEYDNTGAIVETYSYDGDGVNVIDQVNNVTAVAGADGVPDKLSAGLLRGKSATEYDAQGRVFRTHTYSVNPTTGAVGDSLQSQIWYDHEGNVTKARDAGGLVTKTAYDGANRPTHAFLTDGRNDSTWADAGSVADDNVLEQTDFTYDDAGNVIAVATRRRFHDEIAYGALGTPGAGPLARVTYESAYYDALNRKTAAVSVGTNGGWTYTRPATAPAASDDVLVTTFAYDDAGRLRDVTDARGVVTRTTYDGLGRVTKVVDVFTDGVPTNSTNQTTTFAYDAADHLILRKAVLPGGALQETKYVYGVSPADGSDVTTNDLLRAVQHPDKSTGAASSAEQDEYTYDALGERTALADRNGTTHAYRYDDVGRFTADAITTLGGGVDGAVRRIEMSFDSAGRAAAFTSFDAASGGDVVNQVVRHYNGFGQLAAEYQSDDGAVDTGTTPAVGYAYSDAAHGSRLTSMTYPNGRVITYSYASGFDDAISRLTLLADGATTLESYSYLGYGTLVARNHPEPDVAQTLVKLAGESDGDAGDQYTGLDRFGRIVDQRWVEGGTTDLDRYAYGYDRGGNRTYRDNIVAPAHGELYAYDQLDRVTSFQRGTLNAARDGLTGSASRAQSWALDANGNWTSLTTDGAAQSRTHNGQNQLTQVGSTTLAYDDNGSVTTDQSGRGVVYDAWNRIVRIDAAGGGGMLAQHAYDALGRRINANGIRRFFSQNWQVLEERSGLSVVRSYVWSPAYTDAMVTRDRDTNADGTLDERLYVAQDANWNVTALIDAAGVVQERYEYDPYGIATVLDPSFAVRTTSAFAWKHLFQGAEFDAATGLYQFRNRDYSAALGRWLQQDPAGFVDGNSLYQFVRGNPNSLLDPMGLASRDFGQEVSTRDALDALVQIGGGIVELVGGLATAPSIIGLFVAAHGLDNIVAGLGKLTGLGDGQTLTSKAIADLAMDFGGAGADTARMIGDIGDMAVGMLGSALNNALKCGSSATLACRAMNMGKGAVTGMISAAAKGGVVPALAVAIDGGSLAQITAAYAEGARSNALMGAIGGAVRRGLGGSVCFVAGTPVLLPPVQVDPKVAAATVAAIAARRELLRQVGLLILAAGPIGCAAIAWRSRRRFLAAASSMVAGVKPEEAALWPELWGRRRDALFSSHLVVA